MEQRRLEELGWKAVEVISKDRKKTYDQVDLMQALNINILEACEVSNFLVKMKVAKYKK
jgi:hypothetical protein